MRELCWPNVGYPNHLVDGAIRTGFWSDGQFSWLGEEGWTWSRSEIGPQRAESWAAHEGMGLEVRFLDVLKEGETGVWVRQVEVVNLKEEAREVKYFQAHDLHVGEDEIGDTALYDPETGAMVHYGNGIFVAFGFCEGVRADQYACGVSDFGGMQGTWRDAEDGHLAGKAIEQGSVDSTMGATLELAGEGSCSFRLVTCFGGSLEEVRELFGRCSSGEIGSGVQAGWGVEGFEELEPGVRRLVDVSRAMVEAHCDHEGGVLAACDSDIMETARANYNYVWFRDGALVGRVLWETGHKEQAQRFWDYFLRCVGNGEWAYQKYTVRGHLGASWLPLVWGGEPVVPFQQDESALPVWLALSLGLEGGRETCERFLDHMVAYRDENGLPLPSWDLWEERRGVHFWTTATVVEALALGGQAGFARSSRYAEAAEVMAEAVRKWFWDVEAGLARSLSPEAVASYHWDRTTDASLLAGLLFSRFGDEDGWLTQTVERVERDLAVRSVIGGVARYSGDYYFRRSEAYPGNPWLMCTLWLARAKMRLAGDPAEARRIGHEALIWCAERAEATGVLAEQFHPDTGEPLSVSPLTWSHAEVLETALAWRGLG